MLIRLSLIRGEEAWCVQRRADGSVEGEDGGYLYFIVIVSRLNASRRCLGQRNENVDQQNFILAHVRASPAHI
jgi:hypothetical protein